MRSAAWRESRGMDEGTARQRLANQSSQDEKVAAADVVIDGSAPIEETRRQVERALATLRVGLVPGRALLELRRTGNREPELLDQAVDGRALGLGRAVVLVGRSAIVKGRPRPELGDLLGRLQVGAEDVDVAGPRQNGDRLERDLRRRARDDALVRLRLGASSGSGRPRG